MIFLHHLHAAFSIVIYPSIPGVAHPQLFAQLYMALNTECGCCGENSI